MKTADIVQALYYATTNGSTYFSSRYSILSFTALGGNTYRVQTDRPHLLSVDDIITMGGLTSPTPIATATDDATFLSFDTYGVDHDLTKKPKETKSVTIFDNFGFTYTNELINVANRYQFTMKRSNSFSGFPANPLFLMQPYSFGFNDTHVVTAVTSDTFDFISNTYLAAPIYAQNYGQAFVNAQFQIGGAIDLDTAIDAYTEQRQTQIWLFPILGTFDSNKARANENDAYATTGQNSDQYQLLIANFCVYAFLPNLGNTLTDIGGRATRDMIEDVVRPFLLSALLRVNFPTYLQAATQSSVSYAGDSYHQWNGATYIHRFDFQQILTITNADTYNKQITRAFRDLDLELRNQFSDTMYTATVNIDEEPYVP